MQVRGLGPLIISLAILVAAAAQAANTPCSKGKGGISHCRGDIFVCNDGSVSASKKSCRAYMGNAGLMGTEPQTMQPSATKACPCRDGLICTGPRGGRYCMDDNGRKSYLRK
ncbi:hypothetical protein AVM02_10205 [Brucella anthropi]